MFLLNFELAHALDLQAVNILIALQTGRVLLKLLLTDPSFKYVIVCTERVVFIFLS